MEDRRGIRGTEGALWGSADRQQREMGGCTRQSTHTHTHTHTHRGRRTHTHKNKHSESEKHENCFCIWDSVCSFVCSWNALHDIYLCFFEKVHLCHTCQKNPRIVFFSQQIFFFFFCIKINMNTEEWRGGRQHEKNDRCQGGRTIIPCSFASGEFTVRLLYHLSVNGIMW